MSERMASLCSERETSREAMPPLGVSSSCDARMMPNVES
jgi:hypothetical protein